MTDKSVYRDYYSKKAAGMEINERNAGTLIDFYGSIKELEKMDEVVINMINEDLEEGIRCGDIGEIYHEFWKK